MVTLAAVRWLCIGMAAAFGAMSLLLGSPAMAMGAISSLACAGLASWLELL